jgi:hypothetical protein
MKYMDDIVDAGGRLTQSFDPFLNVCASSSPVLISTDLIVGLLRCHPRVPSPTLEQKYHRHRLYRCVLLSVVSKWCSLLQAYQNLKVFPRGANLSIIRGLCILGCKGRPKAPWGVSWVSALLCRSCLFYDTRSSNLVTRIQYLPSLITHSETWKAALLYLQNKLGPYSVARTVRRTTVARLHS